MCPITSIGHTCGGTICAFVWSWFRASEMTVIAGAFSTDVGQAIPASLKAALSQHVSRDSDPETSVHALSSPRCFAIKVDVGAYGEPALIEEPNGSFSALMGDALICDGDRRL